MVPLVARHELNGEPWGRGSRLLLVLLSLFLVPLASAHPANVPSAQIKVAPDGTFSARIRFDAIAFATRATPRDADDRAMNALLDGPDDALAASLADAAGRFRLEFAALEGGAIDRLAFPTVGAVRRFLGGNPSPRLPVMLTALVRGHLPPGARTVAFRYPEAFDTIIQTVEFPYREPESEPVAPGQTSSTLGIPTPEEVARTAAAFATPRGEGGGRRAEDGKDQPTRTTPTIEKARSVADVLPSNPVKTAPSTSPRSKTTSTIPRLSPPPTLVAPRLPPPAFRPPHSINPLGAQVVTYLRMGFTHIVPQGLDHILFVLGLFLLGSNTKALVKQITAFTVAHSITLALTALGVIRLPGRIIEPVIAISIAFVAIENLFTREVRPWRTAVVFAFGMVHGMGFAEVFADAGLSGAGLLTALLSFNVGVELGQLSVVGMAFGVVGWFRRDARYRPVVVVPASLLIAAVALFWSVQRIAG